jgi:hypothetical protein
MQTLIKKKKKKRASQQQVPLLCWLTPQFTGSA